MARTSVRVGYADGKYARMTRVSARAVGKGKEPSLPGDTSRVHHYYLGRMLNNTSDPAGRDDLRVADPYSLPLTKPD